MADDTTAPTLRVFDKTADQILGGTSLVGERVSDKGLLARGNCIDVVIEGRADAPTRVCVLFDSNPDPAKDASGAVETMRKVVSNILPGWTAVGEFYKANASLVKEGKADSVIAKVRGRLVTISFDARSNRFLLTVVP